VKDETAVEGHGRRVICILLSSARYASASEMSFWMEALCSGVEAFCSSAFSCWTWGGMVTISCFTRGIPRCSMLVRVASEEMISTPAGQELDTLRCLVVVQ